MILKHFASVSLFALVSYFLHLFNGWLSTINDKLTFALFWNTCVYVHCLMTMFNQMIHYNQISRHHACISNFWIYAPSLLIFYVFFHITLQAVKDGKRVGKVRCRNVKGQCPDPVCANDEEPVLLDGNCCKTCPVHGKTYYWPSSNHRA